MMCPVCGTDGPEGRRFCGNCGTVLHANMPSRTVRPSSRSTHRAGIVAIVALIVVAIAVVAVITLNPFAQKHSGLLVLTLETTKVADGVTEDFTVYIDGRFSTQGTITGVTSWWTNTERAQVNITVSWTGDNATHQCTVEVFLKGVRYATKVWMADDITTQTKMVL